MTAHEPREPAFESVPHATMAAVRAAMASLALSTDGHATELARAAARASKAEHVSSARLVEIILATWTEVAGAAGIPEDERPDRLALVLARCLEAVVDADR